MVSLAPRHYAGESNVNGRFLALDLGAESGRAVLGESRDGRLGMREVHRFANQPVRENGGLRWDIQRLWQEVRRALDGVGDGRLTSVGVDSWGCDFGLLDERGELLENPYHYRDARTDDVMPTVTALVSPERIYGTTGVQFLPFNTLYQLYAACQQTPLVIESAASLAMIPGSAQLLADRRTALGVDDRVHDAIRGRSNPRVGDGSVARARHSDPPSAAARRAGHVARRRMRERFRRSRGDSGRRAGVSRHRVCGRVGRRRRPRGVSQFGHVVVAWHRIAGADGQRTRAPHELHQ